MFESGGTIKLSWNNSSIRFIKAKCLGKWNFTFSRVLRIDSASKECYLPLRFNILYFYRRKTADKINF